MLKAAGMALILWGSVGLGCSLSLSLSRRERELESLHRLVVYLKGEISYGGTSLFDAFTGAGEKLPDPYREFCRRVGSSWKGQPCTSFGEIFCRCAREVFWHLDLSKEEREEFFSLGERLGYLDLEMQIKQLALYEQELSLHIQKLQKEMPEKKKVYRSLGILGGLFLVILLW